MNFYFNLRIFNRTPKISDQKTETNPNKMKKYLDKFEPYLFYLLLLVGLIPLFTHKYFVTLDGPCHLYNGFLINYLISGEYPQISNLFTFNSFPVPNAISQLLFAFFSTFLPGFLAEKALIFIYLFFTPWVFRKLVLSVNPANGVLSWFMVLFVHNQNFYFGFFNLSFGILLFFLTVYCYMKRNYDFSLNNLAVFGVLITLTYFSHLFDFLVLFVFLTALSFGTFFYLYQSKDGRIFSSRKIWGKFFIIIISSMLGLQLALAYLQSFDSFESEPVRLEFKRLIEWILDIRPLLAIRYAYPWKTFTYLLFIFLMIMLAFRYINRKKSDRSNLSEHWMERSQSLSLKSNAGLATVGFLLLFLVLPNANLLSERLILLFYLFFILWLSLGSYPAWIHISAAIVIIVFHFSFTRMYHYTLGGYSEKIIKIEEVVRDIKPGEVILPLNFNEKWNFLHISGYVGTDHPCAILDNYEAVLPYFPVQWNRDKYDIEYLKGTYLNPEAPDFFTLKLKRGIPEIIPNILLIYRTDSSITDIPANISAVLEKSYVKVSDNDFCALFRMKPVDTFPNQ
jgi:hypothetical protein